MMKTNKVLLAGLLSGSAFLAIAQDPVFVEEVYEVTCGGNFVVTSYVTRSNLQDFVNQCFASGGLHFSAKIASTDL